MKNPYRFGASSSVTVENLVKGLNENEKQSFVRRLSDFLQSCETLRIEPSVHELAFFSKEVYDFLMHCRKCNECDATDYTLHNLDEYAIAALWKSVFSGNYISPTTLKERWERDEQRKMREHWFRPLEKGNKMC
jgi:hypothetical protein